MMGYGYLKRFLLLFPFLAIAQMPLCYAEVYYWPLVTKVDAISSPSSVRYNVSYTSVIVPDNDRSKLDEPLPVSIRRIGFFHRHESEDQIRYSSDDSDGSFAGTSTSFKSKRELFAAMSSQYGNSGTVVKYHTGNNDPGPECTSALAAKSTNGWQESVDATIAILRSANLAVDLYNCISSPPATMWCALVTPVIEFTFGEMQLKDWDGAERKAAATVSCTTGMKYSLVLSGAFGSDIELSNGGKATITADGKLLGNTLNGESGANNTVNVVATLGGKDNITSYGPFEGTGVLMVSYP